MSTAIAIKGLKKTYTGGFQALKGIDLEVNEGDFFALLGPNGAGKSTTIGVLCSLVKKTEGQVNIFGIDIDKNFSKAKTLIGIVPQEFNFNQFDKVKAILMSQAGYYGIKASDAEPRVDYYLKALGLWEKRNNAARMLSGGMKRRLMIARALVHEPKLLILDEPTAGVDIELRRSMWEFLREINAKGTTIILTTHYLEEAESLCRNIAIIDHGKIVENTSVKRLLTQLQEETFILDVSGDLQQDFSGNDYHIKAIDEQTLEASVQKGQGLNDLFAYLASKNLKVLSMRNKANRLEELFVKLVENKEGVKA